MNKQEMMDLVTVDKFGKHTWSCEDSFTDVLSGQGKVIAIWYEDGYHGQLAIAVESNDGSVFLMTDYFGTCSYCCAWQGSDNNERVQLMRAMISSARVFASRSDAVRFCQGVDDTTKQKSEHFAFQVAKELANLIEVEAIK